MNITIIINDTKYNLTINKTDKFKDIKNEIIDNHFKDKDKSFWIEFIYRGNKSIREFGKNSLIINQIIPYTMDNLCIADFSDTEHEFIFLIEEVIKDEFIFKKSNLDTNSDKYIPSFKRKKTIIKKEFEINDYNKEFPSL